MLQNTKDNRFTISALTSFTPDALRIRIRHIDFYSTLKRRFKFSIMSYSLPDFEVDDTDRPYRNSGPLGGTCRSKIQSKTANKSPEFRFSNSRTKIVSVFNIHLGKITHFNKCLTSQDSFSKIQHSIYDMNNCRISEKPLHSALPR